MTGIILIDNNRTRLNEDGARLLGFPPDSHPQPDELLEALFIDPVARERAKRFFADPNSNALEIRIPAASPAAVRTSEREHSCSLNRMGDGIFIITVTEIDTTEEGGERSGKPFFRRIFDAFNFPFYVIDAESFLIHYANAAAGLPEGEKNIHCYELNHLIQLPCDESHEKCPVAMVRRESRPQILEHILYTESGRARVLELHAYPIFDPQGVVEQVVLYTIDNELRQRLESRHREAERRYRSLLDNVRLLAVGLDREGYIHYVNPHLLELTGYRLEEVLEKNWFETFIPPVDRFDSRRRFADLLSAGIPRHLENSVLTREGRERLIAWNVTVLFDEERRMTGTMSIGEDITDKKLASIEREKLNAELSEKNYELEQIIYVSSHDLRSPLVNLQGFGRELEISFNELIRLWQNREPSVEERERISRLLDEEIPESLRFIRSSTQRMDQLLNGLLRISRLERAALVIENINMNRVVAEVLESLGFRIKDLGVELEIEDLPACRGDAVQLNQIMTNLVDNALKYLDPGRPGLIRIFGRIESERSIYCVADNGIGIPKNQQTRIFEIFHRLNPQSTMGEGLGLAIVRKSVQRHGGRIWLESIPGQGSKFYIMLPARTAEDQT